MEYFNTFNSTKPTVNITVNKDRLKIHDLKKVYLKDGDNFEFELFNPSQKVLLVKISIDGKRIDESGLILNPGQRFFLERYFKEPKKFQFSTYKVEAGNSQVDAAISKNGEIKVDFYEEYIEPITTTTWTYTNSTPNDLRSSLRSTGGSNVLYSRSYNDVVGFPNDTLYSSTYDNPTASMGFSDFDKNRMSATMDSLASSQRSKSFSKKLETPVEKETGRIEPGAASDQTFKKVNKTFSNYTTHSVEFKLLPQSQLEVKDLKQYCSSCGKKIKMKTNPKYCSNCGTKLD